MWNSDDFTECFMFCSICIVGSHRCLGWHTVSSSSWAYFLDAWVIWNLETRAEIHYSCIWRERRLLDCMPWKCKWITILHSPGIWFSFCLDFVVSWGMHWYRQRCCCSFGTTLGDSKDYRESNFARLEVFLQTVRPKHFNRTVLTYAAQTSWLLGAVFKWFGTNHYRFLLTKIRAVSISHVRYENLVDYPRGIYYSVKILGDIGGWRQFHRWNFDIFR